MQVQNQNLSRKLETQKMEHSILENKFSQMKDKQKAYDSILTVVNKSWEEVGHSVVRLFSISFLSVMILSSLVLWLWYSILIVGNWQYVFDNRWLMTWNLVPSVQENQTVRKMLKTFPSWKVRIKLVFNVVVLVMMKKLS